MNFLYILIGLPIGLAASLIAILLVIPCVAMAWSIGFTFTAPVFINFGTVCTGHYLLLLPVTAPPISIKPLAIPRQFVATGIPHITHHYCLSYFISVRDISGQ